MKVILCLFIWVRLCQSEMQKELDTNYWYVKGATELSNAYNVLSSQSPETAKNIVLFIGDGMSVSTVTAARILKGQRTGASGEEGKLVFEDFPHVGLIKTYSVDSQVSESASTATAILTGVKTNFGLLGYNAQVKRGNCKSAKKETKLSTVAQWAIDAGKVAGVVTTARITHATPAALYAKSVDRNWECDSAIPKSQKICKDIGRQLIEDDPGRKLKVIMGGGAQQLQASPNVRYDYTQTKEGCRRTDGKDLIKVWLQDKKSKKEKAVVVRTAGQLRNIDVDDTDYLLGIFANDHLPYEALRDKSKKGAPSLANMTHAALRILNKNKNGYLLLVEGGRIDHAHHENKPQMALEETLEFDKAVEAALGFVDSRDTLIIVTADHSHGMSMIGYPQRGDPILGMAGSSEHGVPYTSLLYASGPGADGTFTTRNGQVNRKDLSGVNTSDPNYVSQALVSLSGGAHAGDDVVLYAKGPMSFMFHSLHEQNYIALAISFAACIGPTEREFCDYWNDGQTSKINTLPCNGYVVVLCAVLWTLIRRYINVA